MLEYQRVKTYWTVGHHILTAVRASGGALKPDDALYRRISRDVSRDLKLELSVDTIRRAVRFRDAYPEFPEHTPLTFTHYLTLLRVSDPRERARLEKQAVRSDLSSYELKRRVLELNHPSVQPRSDNPDQFSVTRGEPYIYVARPFEDLRGVREMCVDCGFRIHVPFNGAILKGRPRFSPDKQRYVRSVKIGSDYSIRLAVRKRALIYTYAAKVQKVIDGDTLDALIDVGFGIRVYERLRFRAINAPEVKTPAGVRARNFLTNYLSSCPLIVIRTSKAGMYGRWLSDVFALPGSGDPFVIAQDGTYVNQLLLDHGLAERYV